MPRKYRPAAPLCRLAGPFPSAPESERSVAAERSADRSKAEVRAQHDQLGLLVENTEQQRLLDLRWIVGESEAIAGSAKLRITPQQIMIAHEIFKLYALEAHIARLSGSVESIEGLEKMYRLMVKKRLLKLHREELGACGGKEEQKSKLDLIFHETLRHYRSLLKTI